MNQETQTCVDVYSNVSIHANIYVFNNRFLSFFSSSHLWVALSSMYGKVLVLLMLAFCLTEVMDNQIRPLAFQVRNFGSF